jgi:uncharacterized protein
MPFWKSAWINPTIWGSPRRAFGWRVRCLNFFARNVIRPLTEADRAAAERFLLQHISTSMFLVSNMRAVGIMDGGEQYQGAYVGEFNAQGEIVGVAAHYWNGNVMVQSPHSQERPTNATTLVRAACLLSKRSLRGLVGDGVQCQAVIRELPLHAASFQLNETERLFRVPTAQIVLNELAHNVRRATDADRETLISYYTDYETEALNEHNVARARENAIASVEARYERAHQFVLEQNDEIVAASAFNAQVDSTVQIGGVWTPRALRSRGLARACVAGSLAIARREGATDAILFTGDDNAPARKAYAAIGFREIGSFYISLTGRDVWVSA